MHWYSVCYKEIFRPFLRFFRFLPPFVQSFSHVFCIFIASIWL